MVVVTYAPAHVDDFIRVADELEDAFPGLVVEGVESEEGGAALEVSLRATASPPALSWPADELTDAGIARVVDAVRLLLK